MSVTSTVVPIKEKLLYTCEGGKAYGSSGKVISRGKYPQAPKFQREAKTPDCGAVRVQSLFE
jgi:hypothetical protein